MLDFLESLKSCVGFINLVDSTKNIVTIDNLESIRDTILPL